MAAENTTGNLPNKSQGEYQRPLPRDFEDADKGQNAWKNETGSYGWDTMGVLPAGIFASFDSSITSPSDGDIYIGNGDSSTVNGAWGAGVSQYDWVRYTADTTAWSFVNPVKPQICFDTSTDTYMTFDSTTNGWYELASKVGETSYSKITLNLGDWNMDISTSHDIPHTLSATEWKTVREISVIIRDDSDGNYYKLETMDDTANGLMAGGFEFIDSTCISFQRYTGGLFDSVAFDSTSYNRGWVTITYIKD